PVADRLVGGAHRIFVYWRGYLWPRLLPTPDILVGRANHVWPAAPQRDDRPANAALQPLIRPFTIEIRVREQSRGRLCSLSFGGRPQGVAAGAEQAFHAAAWSDLRSASGVTFCRRCA